MEADAWIIRQLDEIAPLISLLTGEKQNTFDSSRKIVSRKGRFRAVSFFANHE
jgi:hypothetical protein